MTSLIELAEARVKSQDEAIERHKVSEAKKRKSLTEYTRRWRDNNLAAHFIHTIRQRAKTLGLPFELTVEDLTPFPEQCGYCGVDLHVHYGKRSPTSPSVDRMEPPLGYTKVNSVVCCWQCNRRKNDMGLTELEELAIHVRRVTEARK
jgi:hypothetical protein